MPHRECQPLWPPPVANVEAATLALTGIPPITGTTLPTCRAHYPGGNCLRSALSRSVIEAVGRRVCDIGAQIQLRKHPTWI